MKQINFSHEGGFPLEQETLERIQSAYRSELFGALKAHFSIKTSENYIIAIATEKKNGWAIIHPGKKASTDPGYNEETPEGILYPIQKGKPTGYLKTIRKDTNLIYGTGKSQTAYFDYEAVYIEQAEYNAGASQADKTLADHYHILESFKEILDHAALEKILTELNTAVTANTKAIGDHTKLIGDNTKAINDNTKLIGDNAREITGIKKDYLPLDGSKAMTGNLTVQGKVNFNNVDLTDGGALLLLNGSNQVVKNNTLIQSILNEIEALKNKSATAIPKGMIAIWGQPAPFPEGWEEYVPLRGRVPVGLDKLDSLLSNIGDEGGSKNAVLVSHNHTITSSGNINDAKPGGEINSKTARWDTGSGSLLNGTISTVGESGINKNMQPYRVVHFIKYTGEPSDQTPPTAPMTLQATNISSTSVTLSWGESTDIVGVTNYQIFINNVFAFHAGKVLNHDVNGLLPGTKYKFHVVANDQAGNSSANSNFVEETTRLTRPAITHAMLETSKDIFLQWNSSPANENIIGYEIWRSGHNRIFEKIGTSYSPGYADAKTEYSTTYFYKVKSLNGVGNFSDLSEEYEMATDFDPN